MAVAFFFSPGLGDFKEQSFFQFSSGQYEHKASYDRDEKELQPWKLHLPKRYKSKKIKIALKTGDSDLVKKIR